MLSPTGRASIPESAAVGFLNIHKPLHWTSHDVVARLRRHYREHCSSRKVGHAGTLDPLAEGVLVICLGSATRLSEYMMRTRKTYRAEIKLGITTSSYDAAGAVLAESNTQGITLAAIQESLPQFIGEIWQLPPLHSAIKVKGKKLYDYARAGQTVTVTPRRVCIESIQVLGWNNPRLTLDIHCGAGTYIRSLAHDLGAALGLGGHLAGLTRLASGNFTIKDSLKLDDVLQDEGWTRHIIPPFEALKGRACLTLSAAEIEAVRHGRFICKREENAAQQVFAFAENRRLIAILEPRAEQWKPRKVFV